MVFLQSSGCYFAWFYYEHYCLHAIFTCDVSLVEFPSVELLTVALFITEPAATACCVSACRFPDPARFAKSSLTADISTVGGSLT